jgi:hypothetical protein
MIQRSNPTQAPAPGAVFDFNRVIQTRINGAPEKQQWTLDAGYGA